MCVNVHEAEAEAKLQQWQEIFRGRERVNGAVTQHSLLKWHMVFLVAILFEDAIVLLCKNTPFLSLFWKCRNQIQILAYFQRSIKSTFRLEI